MLVYRTAGEVVARLNGVGAFSTFAAARLPEVASGRKSAQVERAIRIKSQEKKRRERSAVGGSSLKEKGGWQNGNRSVAGWKNGNRSVEGNSLEKKGEGQGGKSGPGGLRRKDGKRLRGRERGVEGYSLKKRGEGQGGKSGLGGLRRKDGKRLRGRERGVEGYSLKKKGEGQGGKSGLGGLRQKDGKRLRGRERGGRRQRLDLGTEGLGQSAKPKSMRQTQYDIILKLQAIDRDGNLTPLEALEMGKEIFDPLPDDVQRHEWIYKQMIRLYLRADHRLRAFSIVTKMKKNGVCISSTTYLTLFKHLRHTEPESNDNRNIHRKIKALFEEMVEQWRTAVWVEDHQKGKFGKGDFLSGEVNEGGLHNGGESQTAASYRRSREAQDRDMITDPFPFAYSCSLYLYFLIKIGDLVGASDLIKRSKDLAFPRGTSSDEKGVPKAPSLPYLLAFRYILCHSPLHGITSMKAGEKVLKKAWKEVIKALGSESILAGVRSLNLWEQDSVEIDNNLGISLATISKHTFQDCHEIVLKDLKELFSNPRFANTTPVRSIRTLLSLHEFCESDPEFFLKTFKEVMKVQANEEPREGQRDARPRPITVVWGHALNSAIQLRDVGKVVEILEMHRNMLQSASSHRLAAPFKPLSHQISSSLRVCSSALDWPAAVHIWRLWQPFHQEAHQRSMHPITRRLFRLAIETEKAEEQSNVIDGGEETAGSPHEEKGKETESKIRPSRQALMLFDERYGLERQALWKSEEVELPPAEVLSAQSTNQVRARYPKYFRELFHVTMNVKILALALDTGKQGVDFAKKEDVDKWKRALVRARMALARLRGQDPPFDAEEATFLLNGSSAKTSLALTQEELRELLGNDNDDDDDDDDL